MNEFVRGELERIQQELLDAINATDVNRVTDLQSMVVTSAIAAAQLGVLLHPATTRASSSPPPTSPAPSSAPTKSE